MVSLVDESAVISQPSPAPLGLPASRGHPHDSTAAATGLLHACGITSLTVSATSSASLLLSAVMPPHACGGRPVVEVYWRQPGYAWQSVPEQVSRHGEPLPLELGGCRCPRGCKVAIRVRDGAVLNATALSPSSTVVFTPRPTIAPPLVPGHRLELFLRPPLPSPHDVAARACIDKMIAQLHDAYFVVRRERSEFAPSG